MLCMMSFLLLLFYIFFSIYYVFHNVWYNVILFLSLGLRKTRNHFVELMRMQTNKQLGA